MTEQDAVIQDLQRSLDSVREERDRWRNIADRLYLFIQDPCTHNHWCDICSSIDAYEKAVNGER